MSEPKEWTKHNCRQMSISFFFFPSLFFFSFLFLLSCLSIVWLTCFDLIFSPFLRPNGTLFLLDEVLCTVHLLGARDLDEVKH